MQSRNFTGSALRKQKNILNDVLQSASGQMCANLQAAKCLQACEQINVCKMYKSTDKYYW